MKHTKTIKPTISGQGTARVMLQIGSCQNNYLIINLVLNRYKGRDKFSAFCYFCKIKTKKKMTLRERFGTLCSRLGVEFQCPHCHSNNIIKSSTGNNATDVRIVRSVLLPTTHTKHIFLTLIPKSLN